MASNSRWLRITDPETGRTWFPEIIDRDGLRTCRVRFAVSMEHQTIASMPEEPLRALGEIAAAFSRAVDSMIASRRKRKRFDTDEQ